MCSKYLPLERVHALSSIRHWLMDASMTSCSMLLQMFSRHCCSSSTFRIFELLHCSPDLVIHRVKIWIVRWPLFWWNKVRRVSRYLPNKWQYLTNTSKNSGKGKAICSKCSFKTCKGICQLIHMKIIYVMYTPQRFPPHLQLYLPYLHWRRGLYLRPGFY